MTMPFRTDTGVLPLAMAPLGAALEVRALKGCADFSARMLAMGIGPGREIRLVQREGCHLVLAVGDSRFGIGRGVAQKILVVPKTQEASQ